MELQGDHVAHSLLFKSKVVPRKEKMANSTLVCRKGSRVGP